MTITSYGDLKVDTLLSLSRFAQQMGIDPINFFGGYTSLEVTGACDDIWYEYSWQDGGKVSRQDMLIEIAKAEKDIRDVLGYWPAPRWIVDERQLFPHYHNDYYRNGYTQNIWNPKSVQLNNGYVHYGGQRATTLITTATKGTDIDTTGDGYNDMAVWTITGVSYDPTQIQAFIKEYDVADAANTRTDPESVGADPAWQVRDLRIQYNDTTDIATVYVPRYQMFKPQLQRQINVSKIDAEVDSNYVDDLVFYREYNDPETQVQFLWTSDEACETSACAWSTQVGCMQVRNSRIGEVFLQPSTYDATTETFTEASWTECITPHKVRCWYYAGYKDEFSRSTSKLSNFFAELIAKLAVSRINKPLCTCENIRQLVEQWQENTARADGVRTYLTGTDLENPLGTRVGEVQVWRALSKQFGLRVGRAINTYR